MDEDTQKDGSVNVAYGQQFERLREERGRSRAELANSSGVELVVIEQIERGDGGLVNLDTLRKLAGALDLPLHALFEGVDEARIVNGPFGLRLAQLRGQLAKPSKLTVGTIMDDPSPKQFGAYVKRLRQTHGLTQEGLADRCRLSPDTIRRLEHGAFSPGLDTIRKLAVGVNLSVAQLFAGFEVDGHDEEAGDLVALVRGRGPRTIARIVDLVRVFLRALDERSPAQPRSGR